jgi:seryl-tRNA synthetase
MKKKEAVLTPNQQIEKAKSEVQEAFIMFQQARDALHKASRELDHAVAATDEEIATLETKLNEAKATRATALAEKQNYNKLDVKLAEFT